MGNGSEPYVQKTYLEIDESLEDKIVIVREKDFKKIEFRRVSGLIVIAENDEQVMKNYLYTDTINDICRYPIIQVTYELAEELLRPVIQV